MWAGSRFDHHTARPTLTMAVEKNGQTVTELVRSRSRVIPPAHPRPRAKCRVLRVGPRRRARHGAAAGRGEGGRGTLPGAPGTAPPRSPERLRLARPGDRHGAARCHSRRGPHHFPSARMGGEEAARTFAREQGLDWDTLAPERRAGLLKAGTQGGTGAGRRAAGEAAQGRHGRFRRLAPAGETSRLALRGMDTQGRRCRRSRQRNGCKKPTRSRCLAGKGAGAPRRDRVGEIRAAALRGLIAHGIEKTADIDAVTERFMAKGRNASTAVHQLYWQEAEEPRQAKLTTALHVSQEMTFIALAKEAAADRSDALSRRRGDSAIPLPACAQPGAAERPSTGSAKAGGSGS